MTCCVGEENKLAWEGLEKRSVMGLRRKSLIFILMVGMLLNGYQDRGQGRRRDRKRHDHQIAALHAHTKKYTHLHIRGRAKCLYS